jgi:hypothetical protein
LKVQPYYAPRRLRLFGDHPVFRQTSINDWYGAGRAMTAVGRPRSDARRFAYPLQPLESAIDTYADGVSIEAAMAIRATFAQGSPAVRALFDALVDLPTGGGRKH